MSKKNGKLTPKRGKRPERMEISPEECIRRMLSFPQRKEQIIAAVRKKKNRSVSS
jgi:hypothetical protein